jgi:hypothetical protein
MPLLTLEIPEVAPMLNGSGGLKNMHYRNYMKLRDRWIAIIREMTSVRIIGKVHLTYIRSSVQAPDWDNLCASFKPIGDALVENGVIQDDNPKIIETFTPIWRKAKNNNDLKTIIEIHHG